MSAPGARSRGRLAAAAALCAASAASLLQSYGWAAGSRAGEKPDRPPPAAPTPASTIPAPAPPPPCPLPTHKLSCKAAAAPPRTPVVLVSCGSFNPPTVAHMRMFDLAANELLRRGYDVWGGYMSPVADAYGKAGLAPAADRLAMCRLACGEQYDSSPPPHEGRAPASPHTTTPATVAPATAAAAGAAAGVAPRAAHGPTMDPAAAVAAAPSATDSSSGRGNSTGGGDGGSGTARGGTACARAPEPDYVMVYDWEARQPGYTRTLAVLRRVQGELRAWLAGGGQQGQGVGQEGRQAGGLGSASAGAGHTGGPGGGTAAPMGNASSGHTTDTGAALGASGNEQGGQGDERPGEELRAMLLCGADVLASMARPGVWVNPDAVLREHGAVVVAREGTDLERLLATPGSVLYDNRDRIVVVYDRVGNSISSSAVRRELAAGRPVRYLVPEGVLSYMYGRGLYGAGAAAGKS